MWKPTSRVTFCNATQPLISPFLQRHVSHPRLEELDKDTLVKLYRTTLLPLPQREYGQSRVGKRLAALQSSADSRHQKRKADSEDAVPSTRSVLSIGARWSKKSELLFLCYRWGRVGKRDPGATNEDPIPTRRCGVGSNKHLETPLYYGDRLKAGSLVRHNIK